MLLNGFRQAAMAASLLLCAVPIPVRLTQPAGCVVRQASKVCFCLACVAMKRCQITLNYKEQLKCRPEESCTKQVNLQSCLSVNVSHS